MSDGVCPPGRCKMSGSIAAKRYTATMSDVSTIPFDPVRYEPYISLAVAVGAGLVLGLEREQARFRDGGAHPAATFAGARTHPLLALFGGICALLANHYGVSVLIVGFAAVAWLAVSAYKAAEAHPPVQRPDGGIDLGGTSEVTALLSFGLGALASSTDVFANTAEKLLIVTASTVVAAALLSMKPILHRLAQRLSNEDVLAAVKFSVAAVLVFPWLPDVAMGPYGAFNPAEIGMMILLIAGLDFVGYIGVRLLDARRGLLMTGLLGGLVSSTAVTLSMSGRARDEPELHGVRALAVLLASTVMFARVIVEVAVIHRPLVSVVAIPIGAMTVVGLLVVGVLYLRRDEQIPEQAALKITNPFEMSSAIKFGALFALVLFAAKAADANLGAGGTYVAGVVSGLADVDAITLSMAKMSADGLSHAVAATTILLATATNSLVKAGIACAVGGWAYGRVVLAGITLSLAAGGIGLAFVWGA